MNFFWYPFDIVSCQLELESLESIDKISFEFTGKDFIKNVTDTLDNIGGSNLEGWTLTDNSKSSKIAENGGGKNVSVLIEKFVFKRVFSQEMLQTFVPSLLLSLVSSSSVFMHHELLPARMGVAATTFLSMISLFKNSGNRPQTAHLKMIDFWIIFCYFGAFFCLTEYAYILYLTKTKKNCILIQNTDNTELMKKAMKIENVSRIIISCYTLAFPISFSIACFAHRQFHTVWKSSKISHLNFWILAFSSKFCPMKTNLPSNTVWPPTLSFQ